MHAKGWLFIKITHFYILFREELAHFETPTLLQPLFHLFQHVSLPVVALQVLSRTFFSGDQGCYSCSSEAGQEHQMLDLLTLSNFHDLIHKCYPTIHHSSLEHAIYGTSCLLLAFLNPTTCHLSNLRSINLILCPSPLSLSLAL